MFRVGPPAGVIAPPTIPLLSRVTVRAAALVPVVDGEGDFVAVDGADVPSNASCRLGSVRRL